MSDQRSLSPLQADSRLLRIYWWLLCLAPPLNYLFALEPSFTGRAPEQAVGGFVTVPLLIATLLLAPVVLVRALVSPALGGAQKVACLVLSLAAFPMFLVVQAIWSWLGSSEGVRSSSLKTLLAFAVALWVALAVVARMAIRRNAPAVEHPPRET